MPNPILKSAVLLAFTTLSALAVAADAGRYLQRSVAPGDERAASRQLVRRQVRARQHGRGHVLGREIRRDLAQVVVGQVLDHIGHQRVLAAARAEVLQLVVQVAGRLAGDARVVVRARRRRRRGRAAVARRARGHALRQRVRHGALRLRAERAGKLDGRVYEVRFRATDPAGTACSGTVKVCMPHEESATPTCVEGPFDYEVSACP